MANLILKPSTGGVLKIQNDAGTVDALTVSTGGNLTAAGALAVTGAVTAAGTLGVTGNTTLAGTANALGTVTSGTLGSETIFPAGCAINVTQFQIGEYYWSHPGTNGYADTVMIASPYWPVVLKQANSKILIQVYMSAGGWSSHGYFDIKRGGTSGTRLGAEDGMYGEHRTTGEYHLMGVPNWLDDPGTNAAGTTITYVPYIGQWSSAETFAINNYYNNDNQNTVSKAIFTEIAG